MSKVLIVEDDQDLQLLYERYLKLNDIEIAGIASNGVEAISIYKSLSIKPDVILMDNQMPLMTGAEAAREILQINSNQQIIFLSSDAKFLRDTFTGSFKFYDKSISLIEMIKDIKDLIALDACC